MDIEQELRTIKERNTRVEADKAWETSLFRKLLISAMTYVVASLALYAIGVPDSYLGAVIPTLGFLLSTLTIPAIKKRWIEKYLKQ
jgi:hypothetical protein